LKCHVFRLFNPYSMKPFIVRDCGDVVVVETADVVVVLNKRLEKIHFALRDLRLGFTLNAPIDALKQIESMLEERLGEFIVVFEDEVNNSGECLGSC